MKRLTLFALTLSLDDQSMPLVAGDIVLVLQGIRIQARNLSVTEDFHYHAVLFIEKGEPVSTVPAGEPD